MTERPLPEHKARIYLEKANRYAAAARAAFAERAWDPAVSSAAHAAISANDALCIRYLRKRPASGDHGQAVEFMLAIESLPRLQMTAVAKHFRALLALKHKAEYEDRLCEEDEAKRALDALERLLARVHEWLR